MRVSDIGGEFALIKRLIKKQEICDSSVIIGAGDDCAVVDIGTDHYQLISSDMLVENDHFNTEWFTPGQIGKKLVECNVSDIVSMGGSPRYGVISMSLRRDTDIVFIDELYDGIYAASKKYGLSLIGGDTTHGKELVLNMAIIGQVEKGIMRTRSMASMGDMICVTGKLGGSAAGLMMLKNDIGGSKDHYLNPVSRTVAEGKAIARHSNTMIDVSDGLGSEVSHICECSHVGAKINKGAIPLRKAAIDVAKALSTSAYDYALYGGEDYELVFTIQRENIEKLRKEFDDFSVVGRILDASEGRYVMDMGKKTPIRSGYNHFL